MLKDECIIVNYMDEVIGHDNKYNCHKFLPGQPRGILHRAFSVMLFDAQNRLLLQQRAASKITYPNVWTNTCCSHPLHGMQPAEVDTEESVASGNPCGVKHAAVRKLKHELGIKDGALDAKRFKFMTRVHYWAADVGTHGKDSPWGEHEIDYLLLYRLAPGEVLDLNADPEEVQAVKWIGQSELKDAMSGSGSLAQEMPLWSPWFKIIAARFLDEWWADIDTALNTDKYVDTLNVHRFDTPPQYHGGAGGAKPNLDALTVAEAAAMKESGKEARRSVALEAEHSDAIVGFVGRGADQIDSNDDEKKQGGYGKVPTHSSSKLDQLSRPLEVAAALRLKIGSAIKEDDNLASGSADVIFCNKMLGKVSRSFAMVIRQLPPGLCLDIAVFYLVLRALDTVEDDMEAYKGREVEKQAELSTFGEKRLRETDCSIDGVGFGDERTLLQRFGAVVRVFTSLPEGSQEVIRDITNKMGAGMAEYVAADLGQGTIDQAAYDRYCHMVAGLVGEGLTRIFVARGMEKESICGQGERVWLFCEDPKVNPNNLAIANSMGLFLQKANIIRDYLEDYVDGRAFWPQSVWKKHAITGDLGEFARPTAHGGGKKLKLPGALGEVAKKGTGFQALHCLNELVADALELVPDCLEFLQRLQTPKVFCFCAIPQVMAMATLVECFDNPRLFTGVVKIRKGLAARLMNSCSDGIEAVHWWFSVFSKELIERVSSGSCSDSDSLIGQRVVAACTRILELTETGSAAYQAQRYTLAKKIVGGVALGALALASVESHSWAR